MSKNSWKRNTFRNMTELQDLIMDLPNHVEKGVTVEGNDKPENGYKAIVNPRTGNTSQIVTDSYARVPNTDFFSYWAQGIEEIGVTNIAGYALIKDEGDVVKIRSTFPDYSIPDIQINNERRFLPPGHGHEVGDIIYMGAEIVNSSNRNNTASASANFYRLVCRNGMICAEVIPGCELARNHNAVSSEVLMSDIYPRMDKYNKGILDSGVKFEKIMYDAANSEVIFDNQIQLYSSMQEIFKTAKHAEAIGDIAKNYARHVSGDPRLYLNKWDLYNAATFHTSHNEITPDVASQILVKAETKILSPKAEIPLPVPIQTRVIG